MLWVCTHRLWSPPTEGRVPDDLDVVVVGAGPNGLAAAIEVARTGRSVVLIEAAGEVGGGMRSAELTLQGFVHDVCATVHPLAAASPFFRSLPLEALGVEWVHPEAPLAHPLDDGSAAVLERDLDATADGLGPDARAYRRLFAPLVREGDAIAADVLGVLRPPRHPIAMARFGRHAVRSATGLAGRFRRPQARALLAGIAAHTAMPLDRVPTGAVALFLGLLGHAVGWPVARGGSQRIAAALRTHLESLGGRIETGNRVTSLAQLPKAAATILDLTPRQVARIASDRLPSGYLRRLESYEYGPGSFKLDWALSGPIPWTAPECARAGTVHLGGTLEEIASAEDDIARGRHPDRPFVLLSQQSLFDETRAPGGRHTAWAYCHVPNGSPVDVTHRIERQVERFAPGFRDLILARHAMGTVDLEEHNENYVGGDIGAGRRSLLQTVARPVLTPNPHTTPRNDLYIGSASTPPGPGVHGMAGALAARAALRRLA